MSTQKRGVDNNKSGAKTSVFKHRNTVLIGLTASMLAANDQEYIVLPEIGGLELIQRLPKVDEKRHSQLRLIRNSVGL